MAEVLLKTEELTKSFGGLVAIQQLSLKNHENEIIGVIGANGAGKTTFCNIITGYLKPDSGVILYEGKNITKFNLIESWVVRQFENEYNPVHWHSGHISGAGFLKVPSSLGDFTQDKSEQKYLGGNLNLIHGSKQFSSRSIYQIKPKVGDFYFFPNYLMHTVYPFSGTNEERRSVSFNASIDDEIFNVFRQKK